MKILKQIIRCQSLQQKKEIWAKLASGFIWQQYPKQILPTIDNGMKWYKDGQTNIAENCLLKNIQNPTLKDQPAIYYQNFTTDKSGFKTYDQLSKKVRHFMDVLNHLKIKKGDKVLIYMPNIIETAEAILACCSMGVIFESQHYGVGMIQLKESLAQFNPNLIITSSCTIDHEGIHQNLFYINRARKEIQKQNIKCLIIQRPEKKVMDLGPYDYDFEKIEIKSPSKYINYESLDSNYPLYTFNSYASIDDKIVQNRVIRETGPFMVGLNYSMMRTLGIFQQNKILCLAHLNSNLGLSYMLFGPLLRGASTYFIEDPWVFSQNASKYLSNNKIKTLYIHINLFQKILKSNSQFVEQSKIKQLYLYGNINKYILNSLKQTSKYNNFFFSKTFFNAELGVIACARDWTKNKDIYNYDYIDKIENLEYKIIANQNDVDELQLKIDSYPGIATQFFHKQAQFKFQNYYFKQPMYVNTFVPVALSDQSDGIKVVRRSEEDNPYKLISGIKFIKKQIVQDIQQQIQNLKDFYFLPIQKNQENDFVFFIEMENCQDIVKDQEKYNKLYKQVKETIASSIGDVFEIEHIYFFPSLPKIKQKGKQKIDHKRLRRLIDIGNKEKLLYEDQEIFDFEDFEKYIKQQLILE